MKKELALGKVTEHLGLGENFSKAGMLYACGMTEISLESR